MVSFDREQPALPPEELGLRAPQPQPHASTQQELIPQLVPPVGAVEALVLRSLQSLSYSSKAAILPVSLPADSMVAMKVSRLPAPPLRAQALPVLRQALQARQVSLTVS